MKKKNLYYYSMDKLNDRVLLTGKVHNKKYLKRAEIWEKTSLTNKKMVFVCFKES